MKDMNAILKQLMLNRTTLLIKRFDVELKKTLNNDIQVYRSVVNK